MFFSLHILMTRGKINVTALMFVLLIHTNHQFLTRDTFALVGAEAVIHGIYNFSLVRSAKVLLKAGLTIESMFAPITSKRGCTSLSFGFVGSHCKHSVSKLDNGLDCFRKHVDLHCCRV